METASRPKVFVSYPQREAQWARRFAEALKAEQVDVWIDLEQIPAGKPFQAAVERALRESDVIVSIVTPESAQAPSLYFELGVAASSGKTIIPVVSQGMELSQLPPPLRTRQVLLRSSPADTAHRLAGQLRMQPAPA